jgi:uncharacterized protein (DUF2236 family)
MHLRRYTEFSGRAPSAEKRRTYPEARRQYRMYGVLPDELPADCTWVAPYAWGGDEPDKAAAELLSADATTAEAGQAVDVGV